MFTQKITKSKSKTPYIVKILHTADWHLGKRLGNFHRIEEQKDVLEEICQIADDQEVEAIIIAGDLYDHFNPSNEAEELFYKTLKRLSKNGERAVIAIAGNHDSPERIEAPKPLARACGIILLGFPDSQVQPFELETGLKILKSAEGFIEIQLPQQEVPLRLITTPYANEHRLKKYLKDMEVEESAALRTLLQRKWQTLADEFCDKNGVNILVTHLFLMKKDSDPQEEPEGEKNIYVGGASAIYTENIPKQMQYVALGHLHRYQCLSETPCPIIYSSSPLAYSFAEAHQKKYVVILEATPNQPIAYQRIELKQGKSLARTTCESVNEAVQWLEENQESWVELTMKTDKYLEGTERKLLHETHKGIIAILPQVTNNDAEKEQTQYVDLSKTVEELFIEYFKSKNNSKTPSNDIIALFREMQGE